MMESIPLGAPPTFGAISGMLVDKQRDNRPLSPPGLRA
jgi:hypothetical protein